MNDIFINAQGEVKKTSTLTLPLRKEIWKSFGEIKEEIKKDYITKGIAKRVILASLCVKKMIDLWDKITNNDGRVREILKITEDYTNSMCPRTLLEDYTTKFYNQLETEAYDSEFQKVSLIAFAAIYVANIALYDELLFKNTYDEDLDEELDSFTWDASYLICLAYSDDEDELIKEAKQKEYWLWYLSEAKKLKVN
ncbi:MAG: hypothetical protein K0R05_2892 [Anaerocolumna sp.]|nr:hypothetical protein [Anaerocolumna sp.]